jgi:hypothetical protein
MNRVREMHDNAVRLRDEGASIDAQNKAFDDCEDEFFRTEAFEDISDDEEGATSSKPWTTTTGLSATGSVVSS